MKPIGKPIHPKPVFDREGYQSNLDSLVGERLPDLGRAEARPFAHGGRRPGAGRKSSGNQPLLLRLSPHTIRKLRRLAKRQHKKNSVLAGEILEAALKD
jgi:hypothetical protein